VKYEFAQAATFQSAIGDQAGYNLSEALLALLILLLIGEQVLAWSASYHPAPAVVAAAAARPVVAVGPLQGGRA